MPKHHFGSLKGRIEHVQIVSKALAINTLGDPAERSIAVYLPPDYDFGDDFPLFVDLAGFTESSLAHADWRPFYENLPRRVERLIEEGLMGSVVLAMPDGFTSFGGTQYINSPVIGNWSDFLVADLLPTLEARFRVRKDPAGRAVFGIGSGGFGAIVQGMLYGEHWGGIACHSGDMLFEVTYQNEFPEVLAALSSLEGSVARFVGQLNTATKVRPEEARVLRTLGLCASYDPDPAAPFGVRLPVDPQTSELIPARWQQWLNWDPVLLASRNDCKSRLQKLKLLYVDCGTNNQFNLHWGARALSQRLKAAGIPHQYEEFDDNLIGLDYRLDASLPALYHALQS